MYGNNSRWKCSSRCVSLCACSLRDRFSAEIKALKGGMGRPKDVEGLSSQQEETFERDGIFTAFNMCSALYRHFRIYPSVLPVYQRDCHGKPAVLALDFVLSFEMTTKRVLGASAYLALQKIIDEEPVDEWTKQTLGEELVCIDLMTEYASVLTKRNREDAGASRTHRVQWSTDIEAEVQATSLLEDVSTSELEETQEEQSDPGIEWFGAEDQAA